MMIVAGDGRSWRAARLLWGRERATKLYYGRVTMLAITGMLDLCAGSYTLRAALTIACIVTPRTPQNAPNPK
eukprot:340811-Amphidinium_carterae.2